MQHPLTAMRMQVSVDLCGDAALNDQYGDVASVDLPSNTAHDALSGNARSTVRNRFGSVRCSGPSRAVTLFRDEWPITA